MYGNETVNAHFLEDNEAPDVSDIPNRTIAEGESFATITLDDFVSDADNDDDQQEQNSITNLLQENHLSAPDGFH